jgi:His-Xaa-Ser system protein HxsD
MIGEINNQAPVQGCSTLIQVHHDLVSVEALLKTCYWFSKDFVCDITQDGLGQSTVHLKPKPGCPIALDDAKEQFMAQAMDFALRERVTAKTSDVRDLLLAKAFSESGVLEEQPQGVFGDTLEEAKLAGMFKILSNS